MAIKLGCIADDFTGATDLANNLVKSGMRTIQLNGVPKKNSIERIDADAVVIALKSRTIPAKQAVKQSLQALKWLQGQQAKQIYFKYCSTFDSTADGNIGPVIDALMKALNTTFTIATPAFPDNKRTVFKGYLFTGDVLLNEGGMQNHPLTPMKDANLVRVLQSQTKRQVGLIDYSAIAGGVKTVQKQMTALEKEGIGIAIVDATSNADLVILGKAFAKLPLVTAGSGVAIGLPQNFGLKPNPKSSVLPKVAQNNQRAIISGSCSVATNAQVTHFVAQGGVAYKIQVKKLGSIEDDAKAALAWAAQQFKARPATPILIYSSALPNEVKTAQKKLGTAALGHRLEQTLAKIARGLIKLKLSQLIVAGGETSGACVQALKITQLQIGAQIDPGVPWCYAPVSALLSNGLHIALKSGNFGSEDFFTKSFRSL